MSAREDSARTVHVLRVDYPDGVRTLTLDCGCKAVSNGESPAVGTPVHRHICWSLRDDSMGAGAGW